MGLCVCNGAMMQCSFGGAPSSLIVIPKNILTSNMPQATIMDFAPMVNIMSFGMCNSVANPATKRPPPVLFTPGPCVPNTVTPWAPGAPTVIMGTFPALDNMSKLACVWGGVIQFTAPGQTVATLP